MKELKVGLDRICENEVEAEEELCDGCGSELSAACDDGIGRGIVDEDTADCKGDLRHYNRVGWRSIGIRKEIEELNQSKLKASLTYCSMCILISCCHRLGCQVSRGSHDPVVERTE